MRLPVTWCQELGWRLMGIACITGRRQSNPPPGQPGSSHPAHSSPGHSPAEGDEWQLWTQQRDTPVSVQRRSGFSLCLHLLTCGSHTSHCSPSLVGILFESSTQRKNHWVCTYTFCRGRIFWVCAYTFCREKIIESAHTLFADEESLSLGIHILQRKNLWVYTYTFCRGQVIESAHTLFAEEESLSLHILWWHLVSADLVCNTRLSGTFCWIPVYIAVWCVARFSVVNTCIHCRVMCCQVLYREHLCTLLCDVLPGAL